MVVIFHAEPRVLPGGFVGVDVFFVISGYLISKLLIAELTSTHRISLTAFYARRVRRLMPAALFTSLTTLIVSAFVYGPLDLVRILRDSAWSTIGLANIHFAAQPSGYFATSDPSPLLHFWSLAVEEQFYLIWPVLIMAAVTFYRKPIVSIPIVFTAIFTTSLAFSILLTNSHSTAAYFSLATRAWELAMGGLLAWFLRRQSLVKSSRTQVLLTTLGLSFIALAGIAFNAQTAFPGWNAILPTAGAALVIFGGTSTDPHRSILRWKPLTLTGDISYSLYLWHWPVLVLAGAALNGLHSTQKVLCVALSFCLAALSYRLVEKQGSKLNLTTAPWKVVTVGTSIAIIVCAASIVIAGRMPMSGGDAVQVAPQTQVIVEKDGVPTLPRVGTPPREVPSNIDPAIEDIAASIPEVAINGCMRDDAEVRICEGGDPAGTIRIALVGDSHAAQWWPAIDELAQENGWKLYIIAKSSCPLANLKVSYAGTADPWPQCTEWQESAITATVDLNADLVIWAANANFYKDYKKTPGDAFANQWPDAVRAALKPIGQVSKILYIGQIPYWSKQPAECLANNLMDVAACTQPTDVVIPPAIRELSEDLATEMGAAYFDPATVLCDENCAVMDHNLVMYRDITHLTSTYVRHLKPSMLAMIQYALR